MYTFRDSPKSRSPSKERRSTRLDKRGTSRHPFQKNIHGGVDASTPQRYVPKGGPIALTVDIEVEQGRLNDFYDAIKINAEGSRLEPGCVSMEVVEKKVTIDGKPHEAGKHIFQFYEVWADQDAIAKHRETAHFKKWNEFRFGIKDEIPAGIASFKVESLTLLDI